MTGERKVVVAITGSSGIVYGRRVVEALVAADREVHLVVTEGAKQVAAYEGAVDLDPARLGVAAHYSNKNLAAPMASGSFRHAGMAVVPASERSLSAIATGYQGTLVARAAHCTLKEGRPLVVVPRETPLDLVSLRNLVAIREAGGIVLPASPGFYHNPQRIDDLVDFVAARVLDALGVGHALSKRWGEPPETGGE